MKALKYIFILLLGIFSVYSNSQVIRSERKSIYLGEETVAIPEGTGEPDTTRPLIEFITPVIVNQVYESTKSELGLVGQVRDNSEIQAIMINAERVECTPTGIFNRKLTLQPGTNEFHLVAFDKNNNFTEQKIIVNYSPPEISLAEKLDKESKFYALIIGIDNYEDFRITNLDNPINDARRLQNVLTLKYTFDPENVKLIEDARREDIIVALDDLSNKITPDDNLLIFYAGHGWWDENANIGYWLPADAKKDNKAAWFRNSTLVDYLKEIRCQHTLLITDACFAGAIFKTRAAFDNAPRAIEKLYELPSRKAMTSGTLTEVPDKSAFVEFLLDRLSKNDEKYLSAEQLFSGFRIAVINNSNAIPQFGEISGVGDEGGDFIFILK
ncbi:MAG: caspase family protein [Bacteroidales bacterium]|nr:caspase family protein [Bacteroidales bacterium]